MENKTDKKRLWQGILFFVLNFILLLSLVILMIEINERYRAAEFIANNPYKVIFVASTVLFLSALAYFYLFFERRDVLLNVVKLIELFILLDISILISFLIGHYIDPNARPFAFFAIMCATLLGRNVALFCNVVYALIIFVIDININLDVASAASADGIWQYAAGLLITFCAGTMVIFLSHRVKTRLQSILLVVLMIAPVELIIGVMEILFTQSGMDASRLILLGYGALGSLFSILLYMLLLPLFELTFSELTVFRLREITSPNAKLVKKLKAEALGTYNHSMVVAQLTEACASAIGEDSELARAAAYYHDVGKLKNPEMFTENQSSYNMHDELSPELSADIIRSHAKDGAKLIKKNHLPDFLADVAVQHHGTLPIKYFYAKALKMTDGEIKIENYSYTGPKPQTRIAAIIMIADAAEAAARSLPDRSPAKIEALVGNLIEERLNLDQFDDCDITMRELMVVSRTITQTLSGVYHSRISYPKIKVGKKNEGKR